MTVSNPFVRSFLVGVVWYGALLIKIMSQRGWSVQTTQILIVCIAWFITASLVGVLVRNVKTFQPWLAVALSTVVMGLMFLSIPAR